MAVTPGEQAGPWLIDKSALAWLGTSPDVGLWANRIDRGLVHSATVTLLELGYSARTAADMRRGMNSPPVAAMPVELVTPAIEERAAEVQALLAGRNQHRTAAIPDLLIAATAKLSGLVVRNVDEDFDLIAAITGQPVEILAS